MKSIGTRRNSYRKSKMEMYHMNATPMLDFMIILLIVFYCLYKTSMINFGVNIDLPQSENRNTVELEKNKDLFIFYTKDGFVSVNDEQTQNPISKMIEISPDRSAKIVINADDSVPYGKMASMISEAKNAGFKHVILVTKPPKG